MKAKEPLACAASHVLGDWHTLKWAKINQNVRRFQARIVKATREGRWGKVQALQRLLTHSLSGKALAVRRVTENQGKHTPGVDHVVWNTPEKKAQAIHALRQRSYRPQPLRRIYIPKSNGNKRPLGIPVMHDRAMQALYLLALDPVAETLADRNSYGFRKERAPADALVRCHQILAKQTSARWILEGDIRACFDKISHAWLLANIPLEKEMLKKWLKAGYLENHVRYPTEEGTPQGGLISPVLANMTLDGLEGRLQAAFPRWKKTRPLVNFARYADDFIVTGRTQTLLEQEVRPLIAQFMQERGLELSLEKTKITPIETGFDFLGQQVRKYHGTLLITPARKNVKTFMRRVRLLIKAHTAAPAGQLIVGLNPVIQGWANYHRHACSKATFRQVDHAIFTALWRWARRRHPKKNARWVKNKYFKTVGTRQWVFTGEIYASSGAKRQVALRFAGRTPIRYHTKIKADANPYDPAWEPYFEHRLGLKMASTLQGRHQLLHLWQAQAGLCPVCNRKITELTGWHNHHLVWRTHGGGDQLSNRVLLHPECHRQVHRYELTVVKPRPITGVEKA